MEQDPPQHRILRPHPLVLVVDDDDTARVSVIKSLREAGLDGMALADGLRLVETAVREQPDLILLDVDVSGLDARDLLQELKRDPRTQRIPVFTMSDRIWARPALLELGADECLDKPLFLPGLAQRARFYLEKAGHVLPGASLDTTDARRRAVEIDRLQADVLRLHEQKHATPAPPRPASNRPVLIVEDDDDIREGITHLLEDQGIATLAASNGQEALDLLRSDNVNPLLILLDLTMPVMDGWEFRQQVESDASIPHPPVVVMSSRSRDERIEPAAWLQKPLDAELLLSTIARIAHL